MVPNLCGQGNPLADRDPTTEFGEPLRALVILDGHSAGHFAAVAVSVWSLAIRATFVRLVAGMGLVPDIVTGLNKAPPNGVRT